MRPICLSLLILLLGALAGCVDTVRTGPARLLPGRIFVRNVQGEVKAIDAMGTNVDLQDNVSLRQGTVVTTGAGGSVTLILYNGTTLDVAQKSEVLLDSFMQLPSSGTLDPTTITSEPSISVTKLTLRRGTISGSVPRLNSDRGSSFVISTAAGEKTFDGTPFKVSADSR